MKIIARGKSIRKQVGLILLTIVVTILLSPLAFAVPNFLSVQGKLTNVNDEPRTGEFNFTFSVYNESTGGTLYWQENKKLNTTGNGFWSTLLGSSTSLNLTFDRDYFLEVMVNGETLLPRFRLATSPYAFRVETILASNVTNGTFQTKNYVFPENLTVGKTLTATNLSGSILCNRIVGGTDADYCVDTTGAGGAVSGTGTLGRISKFTGANEIGDSNLTENAAGSITANFNFTVNKNLTVSDKMLANASLLYHLNLSAAKEGFISQAFISGITIPASNVTAGTFETGSFTFPGNLVVNRNLTVSTNILFVNNDTGRVGIGTTSPTHLLSVAGSTNSVLLNLSDGPRTFGIYVGSLSVSGTGASLGTISENPFRLYTNNTDRISIDTLGNVGIGSMLPTAKLEVNGTATIIGNTTVKQQNNVANNTWRLFYDTTGTCRTKMGVNGTHFVITSC